MAKYINHKDLGMLIFDEKLNHANVAKSLYLKKDDIISAGFIKGDPKNLHVQGFSRSLQVDAKESDNAVLDELFQWTEMEKFKWTEQEKNTVEEVLKAWAAKG